MLTKKWNTAVYQHFILWTSSGLMDIWVSRKSKSMLPGMSKAKVVKMEKHSRIRSYLFWFDLIISQNDKIYRGLSNIVNNVRRKRMENAT